MDADTIFLVLRVVVALGVVLAVLWVLRRRLAKGSAKPAAGRPAARRSAFSLFGRPSGGATAAVRGRHALGQKSSVAVVEFDGREFLLGVTEHGVTVLHAAGSDGEDVELDELDESVDDLPAAPAAPVPVAEMPVAEASVEAPAPAPADAEPAPDWAALFAHELAAAQQAMAAQAATPEPAPQPVAQPVIPPAPIAPEPVVAPAAHPAHEPATVFAPRYARSTAPAAVAHLDEEIDPSSGLVPQPMPVRTVITGQFVAEVELMPLPTSAIPVVPAAPEPAPTSAPMAAAPAPTPRPAPTRELLPTTAMIPTIVMAPRPVPAPVVPAAASAPEPAAVPVARPAAAQRPASSSPLAGSILSPDTWRQTVDAFRQLR